MVCFGQVSLEVSFEQVTEGTKLNQGMFATINPSIVIEKDGTAAELYSSTMNWINEAYKSPEEVIKGNVENKYIKINGFESNLIQESPLATAYYYDATYTIEFRFKENKFKVDIISLERSLPSYGWYNYPMKFKVENRKGKPKKDGVANLASVTTHFENIINSVKEYSINTIDSSDFDF
tara:strand:+ start:77 stop:613 length:537 start_codon:yes stop_codon:yes gene_type:complete